MATSNTNNPSSHKLANFIEALKQRQQMQVDSPDRPSPMPFSEFNKTKELEKKRIEQFHQARSKEWAGIYSAKQKRIEKRIEEIVKQLKSLINQVVQFDLNVTEAITSHTPTPGVYHISFFEHLRSIIELYKTSITETNSWLAQYNQRSKKKGHYWGKATSQGTSFTLSEERQVSTSIG